MDLYFCCACSYVFKAEIMPESCPACHQANVFASTDFGKKVELPAVRPASEAEMQAYSDAEKAAYEEKAFLEWIDSLPSYDLSDDEYHMALMLLHHFKTTPGLYTKHFIGDLLPAQKGSIEERAAQAIARILHIDVKEAFTSRINRERQDAGTNDIAEVAAQTPPDSAANVLRKFRRDEL